MMHIITGINQQGKQVYVANKPTRKSKPIITTKNINNAHLFPEESECKLIRDDFLEKHTHVSLFKVH